MGETSSVLEIRNNKFIRTHYKVIIIKKTRLLRDVDQRPNGYYIIFFIGSENKNIKVQCILSFLLITFL